MTEQQDSDKLMVKIDALEFEVLQKSMQLLGMRNEWLANNGWEITKELIGPTVCYFYQKNGELYFCEHEAIDRELSGK